jgi:ABC-2 type transport system permease protein
MIIYVTNLGYSTRYSRTLELVVNDWKALLSYFNLAATCFILSILTTRFVYPMLSLEGRGFWTVGLAPIPRGRVVVQKYILCLMLCLTVALPLVLLSNVVLDLPLHFTLLSLATTAVMGCGLTSLSVGLGAMLPDFKEDNPARIANGVGGTLNVLLSLAYIGLTVGMLALPLLLGPGGARLTSGIGAVAYYGFMGVFQMVVIGLPIRLGLSRWEKLEF